MLFHQDLENKLWLLILPALARKKSQINADKKLWSKTGSNKEAAGTGDCATKLKLNRTRTNVRYLWNRQKAGLSHFSAHYDHCYYSPSADSDQFFSK